MRLIRAQNFLSTDTTRLGERSPWPNLLTSSFTSTKINIARDDAFSCAFIAFPRILLYETEHKRQASLGVNSVFSYEQTYYFLYEAFLG